MKLIRLKLNAPFRSLPAGFEINFLREDDFDRCLEFHPYCFAGRNGSGKSNVLEALAAIFYHIECINLDFRPDGFEYDEQSNPKGFRAEICTPDAFELEYLIPIAFLNQIAPKSQTNASTCRIRIVKKVGSKPEVKWLNPDEFADDSYSGLVRNDVKSVLPRYILGYSSGHNEILSLPFFKMRFIHFDEYRLKLLLDDHYTRAEGRLVYLDEQFSQAILISHFLFPSDPVIRVFEKKIGLRGIQRFRIIIRRGYRLRHDLGSLTKVEQEDESKNSVELTSKLSGHYDDNDVLQLGLIDKLIKCSTAHHKDYSAYSDDEGYEPLS